MVCLLLKSDKVTSSFYSLRTIFHEVPYFLVGRQLRSGGGGGSESGDGGV